MVLVLTVSISLFLKLVFDISVFVVDFLLQLRDLACVVDDFSHACLGGLLE